MKWIFLLLDVPCSSLCTSEQACVRGICTNVGRLGVALTWSRVGDADIILNTPLNKSISWRNKGPTTFTDGGFLDRDDRVATGPENIYWPTNGTNPPNGTYHLCMQPYAFTPVPSADSPVYATITVRWPLNTTLTFTKTITERYVPRYQCFPNSDAYMGSFTFS